MTDQTRRHTLQGLIGLGLMAAAQKLLAQGNKPVPPGIYSFKGDVRVNGQPAVAGAPVPPGATVTTGRGAQVVFVIGQDAFLQREESVVNFGTDAAKDFFRVVSGKLLSVFGKGAKTLRTPTATIGVRGTGCYIEATEKAVYFCLCYGEADLIPVADPSKAERIVTRHHDHPVLIHSDSAMPTMAPATVVNHTDDELTLLENLTGRWPPFHGSENRY